MIIWFFMILDIFVISFLTLAHFGIFHSAYFLLLSAGYLIIKFLMFRDLMSTLDLIAGIYIILVALFGITTFFYWFIFGWILYKVIFTLLI